MNKIIIAVLMIFCLWFAYDNKCNKDQLNKLELENRKLSEDLKASVSMNHGKIQVLYRDREKIKYIDRYIPPEGSGTITIDNNDNINVDIKSKGFTFMPQLGLGVASSITPQLSARLVYWERYGTGLGLSTLGAHLFIDRRIDDFINFMPNSSIGVFIDRQNTGLKLSTFF